MSNTIICTQSNLKVARFSINSEKMAVYNYPEVLFAILIPYGKQKTTRD